MVRRLTFSSSLALLLLAQPGQPHARIEASATVVDQGTEARFSWRAQDVDSCQLWFEIEDDSGAVAERTPSEPVELEGSRDRIIDKPTLARLICLSSSQDLFSEVRVHARRPPPPITMRSAPRGFPVLAEVGAFGLANGQDARLVARGGVRVILDEADFELTPPLHLRMGLIYGASLHIGTPAWSASSLVSLSQRPSLQAGAIPHLGGRIGVEVLGVHGESSAVMGPAFLVGVGTGQVGFGVELGVGMRYHTPFGPILGVRVLLLGVAAGAGSVAGPTLGWAASVWPAVSLELGWSLGL